MNYEKAMQEYFRKEQLEKRVAQERANLTRFLQIRDRIIDMNLQQRKQLEQILQNRKRVELQRHLLNQRQNSQKVKKQVEQIAYIKMRTVYDRHGNRSLQIYEMKTVDGMLRELKDQAMREKFDKVTNVIENKAKQTFKALQNMLSKENSNNQVKDLQKTDSKEKTL